MPFLDANALNTDTDGLELLADVLGTGPASPSDGAFRAAFDPMLRSPMDVAGRDRGVSEPFRTGSAWADACA